MNSEFQREERYIVIKSKHLAEDTESALRGFLGAIDVKPIECVVIEHDWPEYEPVWEMIQARVDRTTPPTEAAPAASAGLDIIRAEFKYACSLLPPDFVWGLPVTPRLVLDIALAAKDQS